MILRLLFEGSRLFSFGINKFEVLMCTLLHKFLVGYDILNFLKVWVTHMKLID